MGEVVPFPVGAFVGRNPPPIAVEEAASVLERHPDFRVLRRLPPYPPGPPSATAAQGAHVGCALDVETTGLDPERDRVVELCLQRFRFDERGRITQVGEPRAWLEDPGRPLSPEIERLTGLTDLDVAGQTIDDRLACAIVASADVVVAHNAAFDRPFVEARLPKIAGGRWVCSLNDLDWRSMGFEGRSLGQLLGGIGWFFDAHRAEHDVLALIRLLDHELDHVDTVLRALIANASRPTWLIRADGAPFAARALLKERGYRWHASSRAWRREVPEDLLRADREWIVSHVYEGAAEPSVARVTWRERYGALLH